MKDTNIEVDGDNSILGIATDGIGQSRDKLVQGSKEEALASE